MPRSEHAHRLRRRGVALRRLFVAPLVMALRVSDQQDMVHEDLVRWKQLRFDRPGAAPSVMIEVAFWPPSSFGNVSAICPSVGVGWKVMMKKARSWNDMSSIGVIGRSIPPASVGRPYVKQ